MASKGNPLEGERPINEAGVPVQSLNKEPQTFRGRLYQHHLPQATTLTAVEACCAFSHATFPQPIRSTSQC